MLFTTARIGRTDNTSMIRSFGGARNELPALRQIVLLAGSLDRFVEYEHAVTIGSRLPDDDLKRAQSEVSSFDTCNLQFTSGSTGHPKAAMLTQHGLLNNSCFIGDRMSLTSNDILCCPVSIPMDRTLGL